MSKMRIQLSGVLAVLAVTTATAPAWTQAIFYDNTSNPLGEFKSMGNLEFGDRVQMNLPTGIYSLTDFQFGYYAPILSIAGGQQATLRIYENNGPVTAHSDGQFTPGTKLFDSALEGQYINLASSWNHGDWNGNGRTITVPDSFTWTVQFTGLAVGDVVGLPLMGNMNGTVDVGSSGIDFWAYENGEWAPYVLESGTPVNFEARAVAIPEPSAVQLALLAGAGWLGLLAFRRRS
jgi:hypothetical protein